MKDIFVSINGESAEIRQKRTGYLLAVITPHRLGLKPSGIKLSELLKRLKALVESEST